MVADAIRGLAVRGAPNIGVAAAYGLAVEGWRLPDRRLRRGLGRAAVRLRQTRPTAVNLAWALGRFDAVVADVSLSPSQLRMAVEAEAIAIEREEMQRSLLIARFGAQLIRPGARILTLCNTGPLAAVGMGTALGSILQAQEIGRRPEVYVCETRPLLQGARLTALELQRAGVRTTLIVDSAAATVIQKCDLVLVGADRIALNGDTANKTGTKTLAVLAHHAKKPFWVAAPASSFDLGTPTGHDIAIEERSAEEVVCFGGRRSAPAGVCAYNPAFDVTPAKLLAGFITDRGLIRRPFRRAIGHMAGRTRWLKQRPG